MHSPDAMKLKASGMPARRLAGLLQVKVAEVALRGCAKLGKSHALTLLCAIARQPLSLGLVSQPPCDEASQDPGL